MRWGLALIVVLVQLGCEPPCLRGHYEPQWVPERCYPVEITKIGDVPIYMQQCDPPYWKSVFVCDQYQAEKL